MARGLWKHARALQCASLCVLLGCGSDDDDQSEKAPESAENGAVVGAKGEEAKPDEEKTGDQVAEAAKPEPDADDTYKDYPDPRGACEIDSGYADDHACILAPAPEEGMQIHVGPSDYANKEEVAKFILHPGEEISECWTLHTPNAEDIYYQTAVLSGRAGTHHIINQMLSEDLEDGGFSKCSDGGTGMASTVIGALPGASKPYMARGHVAPENKYVGSKVPAHATMQADMHYYNFTDQDIIREFWLNVFYVDKSEVREEASQIRGMGGFSWNRTPIAPGTDEVYKYECPVKGEGRILSLLGHYHAHGRREAAYLKRGDADPMKVFEMYDYMDPASFEYDSRTKNPAFSETAAGAVTGVLDVHDGDVLSWECHIVNDSNVALKYVNEVKTGEMCNLWGSSLGIETFDCLKP